MRQKRIMVSDHGDCGNFIEISSKKYQQMKKENSVKPIYK